jgi:hypothetical protein
MSEYGGAARDLAWLTDHSALAGVAEIIAERRRQIEAGHTVAGDAEKRAYGGLVADAAFNLMTLDRKRSTAEDSNLPAAAAADELELRRAGALIAAEIDRKYHGES